MFFTGQPLTGTEDIWAGTALATIFAPPPTRYDDDIDISWPRDTEDEGGRAYFFTKFLEVFMEPDPDFFDETTSYYNNDTFRKD
jgi:hypothetical protein